MRSKNYKSAQNLIVENRKKKLKLNDFSKKTPLHVEPCEEALTNLNYIGAEETRVTVYRNVPCCVK